MFSSEYGIALISCYTVVKSKTSLRGPNYILLEVAKTKNSLSCPNYQADSGQNKIYLSCSNNKVDSGKH